MGLPPQVQIALANGSSAPQSGGPSMDVRGADAETSFAAANRGLLEWFRARNGDLRNAFFEQTWAAGFVLRITKCVGSPGGFVGIWTYHGVELAGFRGPIPSATLEDAGAEACLAFLCNDCRRGRSERLGQAAVRAWLAGQFPREFSRGQEIHSASETPPPFVELRLFLPNGTTVRGVWTGRVVWACGRQIERVRWQRLLLGNGVAENDPDAATSEIRPPAR